MTRLRKITLLGALALAGALSLAGTARADAPYMGVDTWYAFGSQINEQRVVDLTDAVVARGLANAGYRYVWLDAGWWEGARNADGSIAIDPNQWPHAMAWLASYIHSQGLLAGIYEETGAKACYNGGALGHVQQDVNTFAAWGFDALKVDYCGDEASLRRDPADVFSEFAHAIANDRPRRAILLNACDPDTSDPYPFTAYAAWSWGPSVAASWRTNNDLSWPPWKAIRWVHLLRNIDSDAAHPQVAGNGHWNDPDYLAPMLLSPVRAQAQFTMWAILAAPMMLSADVTALPNATVAMATNPELLAISQDALGVQGRAVAKRGTVQLWVRPLSDRAKAVALLNRGARAQRVTLYARALGLRGALTVRDVWTGASWRSSRLTLTVAPTSARLLHVRAGLR
jgi:alpha-galactosidase